MIISVTSVTLLNKTHAALLYENMTARQLCCDILITIQVYNKHVI